MRTASSERDEPGAMGTDGGGATRRLAVSSRRLTISIAAVLACAFAACGPSESEPPDSGQGVTAAPLSSLTLDIDGDGKVTSHSDALLILRYTSGIRGKALVEGAVSPDCERCSPEEIGKYLDSL